MEVQAKLGSDIALVFDECTPYHADREYTARSMERTHRWLGRCLEWHDGQRPRAPGGLRDRPGRRPRGPAAGVGAGGLGCGGRRDRDRRHPRSRQGGDAGRARADRAAAAGRGAEAPAGDRRRRRPARRRRPRPRRLRLRDPDPPRPPRHRARPRSRATASASTCRKAGWEGNREPLVDGCPCDACTRHDRDYLSYLSRAEELTAVRLLCLHNLTYPAPADGRRAPRYRGRGLRRLQRRHLVRRVTLLTAMSGETALIEVQCESGELSDHLRSYEVASTGMLSVASDPGFRHL